ncbi:sodium:solute symporter family protein [Constantimarinum furrinae]|uniref:Sodium:solute symporter family protein n=1 Tax=Constantimarinum furrinae TaxID=2562285 RepID=A0A7G8PWH7_9FLAO|nr:sodium:solute symporter family protein [Constantimarinum furrinae]QNJ98693.1 Sodium:solute symporter family protein [Constantimarinum furrinae]
MKLDTLDWILILSFFVIFLIIGLVVAKRSGKNTSEFFLSGRNMPWWLLGISMVATTFSADTPNLVTDIVRQNGVSGNWVWWTFLITGMLTVFVYAKLWRRSKVLTDLQFYELRYSGKEAAFLRGFRAIYLGVFFNVMIMASVCLAAIKIGGIMFGLAPWECVLYASVITVAYSSIGGLRGVIFTDFLQFIVAMIGSVWAAYYIVNMPEIGGLQNLLAHENVTDKLNFLPDFNDTKSLMVLLIIPIAVQWWSVWYPGAEPGGGGYIAQRMLSAKDEKNAIGATLLFNVAHYALRPWPWIIIALASLVLYPQLSDIGAEFPNAVLGHDLGYSAMLTNLPAGLLGLVVASLIAAFMSTISTHLNWGSSYISLDFYKRFIKPEATEKELVHIGRLSTIVLMVLAAALALLLSSALSTFEILLQIGAGTGLIFILRWFWWRVNAYSEIAGMIVSFIVALTFEFTDLGLEGHEKLIYGVAITTVSWIAVTLLTRPTNTKTLANFYNSVTPYGMGWKPFKEKAQSENISLKTTHDVFTVDLASMLLGILFVYTSLFGTGYIIYGNYTGAAILLGIAILSAILIFKLWKRK